jgi:hypothetical protein
MVDEQTGGNFLRKHRRRSILDPSKTAQTTHYKR